MEIAQGGSPGTEVVVTFDVGDVEAVAAVMQPRRRRPPLTEAEKRWYQSTIHEAYCHLEARTNSAPEKWFSSLYDARFDFSHIISQLKAVEGKSE